MIERFEKFSFSIFRVYRYLHKIMGNEMTKYGLKGAYAFYLLVMYRAEEGVTATQLCDICDRNKADVSRAVSEMESKGFIYRDEVNNNRYRAKLKLTEKGIEVAKQLEETAGIAVSKAGSGLNGPRLAFFYDALERIAGNLQIISAEGLSTED